MRYIPADYLSLYRLDRIIFDKSNWEISGRLVSSCTGILMPVMKVTIAYRKYSYSENYTMDFACQSLDKEYEVKYETREKLRDLFSSICAGWVIRKKNIKLVYVRPDQYKEVKT